MSGVIESLHGYNLYAYCFNNPVSMSDLSGNWPKWLKKLGKKVSNFVDAVFSSLEIEVAIGFGVGSSASDKAKMEASRSSFVRLNDGVIETGNTITAELSLLNPKVKIGDTFEHLVEVDGQRVSSAKPTDGPLDMLRYPDVVRKSTVKKGKTLSASASLYLGLGGRISVGFNLSEFKRRLKD